MLSICSNSMNSRSPARRQTHYKTWKRPAHGGGHLVASKKNQTPAEFAATKQHFADAKARWEYLFSKELNKWKPQQDNR